MVFLFQNEENNYRRRQNPPLMAPITTRKTYHLKDEALYLTSVLRAGLEEAALNADRRGLLSRALAKGELNQFLVDFFSEPSNLMFARGKVEERRRKMAHLSGLDPIVPEHHTGRRHPEDSMDRKVAFSHDKLDHRRFVETDTEDRSGDLPMEGTSAQGAAHDDDTASCSRPLSELKEEASQGLYGSEREDSVKSCVSLLSVSSESTLGTTDGSSFASRHGAITGDERNLRRRGKRRHGRHGKTMFNRTGDVRRRVENFHFESHLLHRACGVTGNGSDDSQSECSLLEDSGEDQLSKLRRNPVIMDILVRLKALSLSLVHPRGSLGVETVSGSTTRGKEKVEGGRTGGVDTLCLAQEGYVGLFEEMLSEILRMQRHKSKVLRVENEALRREVERCRKTEIRAKAEADAYVLQLEVLSTSKKALEIQVAAHEVQLKAMSEEIESHAREDRVARQQKEDIGSANKRKALVEALKEEEHTLRRRFNEMEEVAERAELAEAGEKSVRHLKAKMDRTADIKHCINVADKLKEVSGRRSGSFKHSTEAFTQTVADDDGLWDRQDGWTKDVSGSTLRRLRWQAVRRFASCPSCRGMGAHSRDKMVKGKWKHVQDLLFKDDPKLLHQRSNKKKPKRIMALDRSWSMPDQLVEFMSHLPKTAQALPIKSLRWLTREIWVILDERERADAIDAHEGQHIQSMNDFVLEVFLRRHLLRQDAEMQLYIFLASLKAHYKKSTGAHTFARMMDLLEDVEFSKGKQSKAGDGKELVTPNNAHIGTALLPVVLFTRRALLKRPPVDLDLIRREKELNRFDSGAALATPLIDTPPAHSQPSDEAIPGEGQRPSNLKEQQNSTDKLQDSKDQRQHSNDDLHGKGKGTSEASREGEVPLIDLPPHVYTQAYCTFWVTLDTAVRVLTIVLHWCPPMKRHAYMRVLEKNASLLSSKKNITEGQACHSFIRSVMRKTIASVEFELDACKHGATADTGTPGHAGGIIQGRGGSGNEKAVMTEHDAPGNARVVIDIDRVVQLVVEVLLQRQSSIEQSLKTLFAEGDENGDGVLTFDEFSNIVTRAAPHFSERRILRMFREALTTGSEDSYAIEKETFCKICRQHGLVQLIDIETLEKMASSSRGRLCISKPSPPPSAARLLPPTVTSPTVTPPTVISPTVMPPTVMPPMVTPPTVTYPTVTPPRVPPQSITLPAITLPPVEGWPDGRGQSERRRLTYF